MPFKDVHKLCDIHIDGPNSHRPTEERMKEALLVSGQVVAQSSLRFRL